MKIRLLLGAAFLIHAVNTLAAYDEMEERPVEYVKICSLYGAGYFYIPGTDTCLNPSTGLTIVQTVDGSIHGQSNLAKRVSALETELKALEEALERHHLK